MWSKFADLWLEAMSQAEYRLAFEAIFGAAWGICGYLLMEKHFRQSPAEIKRFFPVVVAGFAIPASLFITVAIPGLLWRELVASMAVLGGAASHVSHDAARRLRKTDEGGGE